MSRRISHSDPCFSESKFAARRAALYEAAYKAGLTQAQADDWVHQQLYPRCRSDQDKTPTLFGALIAKDHLAQKKSGVR